MLVFMCLSMSTNAQEKLRKEIKGDAYTFNYSYDKAIEKYTATKDLTIGGQRKLAEAYSKTEQYAAAELVYSKIVVAPAGVVAEDHYQYAMLLKSGGKYTEAHQQLDQFNRMKPTDLRAIDYMANKSKLGKLMTDDGDYKVLHMDINTKNQDFAAVFYKNQIVFASTKAKMKMIKRTYNSNGLPFLDMYVANIEGEQLKDAKNFDKGLNTKLHDGPASFNQAGTFVAFTRNHSKDKSKDKIVELQIFTSTYENGKWTEAIPFKHNNSAYNVGHPSLSSDGKTMYFASDMPGGFGGTDIYKTVQDASGSWTILENLGSGINTEGDELFPFVEEVSATLFFSSNGRFGLGGQDVFMATTQTYGFGNAENAGSPLNTQYDDFAAIANGNTQKGYFSSNRVGGSGNDDIYGLTFLKGLVVRKTIEGLAKDKSGKALSETFITLQDEQGNVLDTITTKEDATFSFKVDSDKKFKLIGHKEKYNDGQNTASTFGADSVVKADIVLLTKKDIIAEKVESENEKDLGKIAELNTIYFDLDKFNLRPDAVVELDKIIAIMNDHPNIKVELSSYTDCRESESYNQILSDKRAKTSAWYIKKRITNPERISAKGYGKTNLVNGCYCDEKVVSDCSEEEHQKNRRTEFTIIKSTVVKK
jgi:outer membrane protein OmpA-like peptidoglycan-associated protein/tetratricopeptide (TPR) repeat protein